MADNPPFGAVFTYYQPKDLKTKRQQRREKERKVAESGGDNPPPGWDVLRDEEFEEPPEIVLTVRNAEGQIVNRVVGPAGKGLHRVAWDLRYSAAGRGPLAVPGTYTVEAAQRMDGEISPLAEPMSFEVVAVIEPSLERQDRQDTLEFQLALGELQRRVFGAARKLEESLDQLEDMKAAIKSSRKVELELYEQARGLELRLESLSLQLTGDELKSRKSQTAKRSISERIQTALYGTLGQSYGPTQTHRDQFTIAESQFEAMEGELRQAIETDLKELATTLDEAGVAWTSGRAIPN